MVVAELFMQGIMYQSESFITLSLGAMSNDYLLDEIISAVIDRQSGDNAKLFVYFETAAAFFTTSPDETKHPIPHYSHGGIGGGGLQNAGASNTSLNSLGSLGSANSTASSQKKTSVQADIAAATTFSAMPADPVQCLAAIKAKESLARDLKKMSRIDDALKVMREIKQLKEHLDALKEQARGRNGSVDV